MFKKSSEFLWAFRLMGPVKWLPVPVLLAFLPAALWAAEPMGDMDSVLLQTARLLPLFAFVWPVLSLREAYGREGGETLFAYRRRFAYWLRRAVSYSLFYAVPAALVAFWVVRITQGAGNANFPVRVFVLSLYFGLLGFFTMLWTKDAGWAALLVLGLYLALVYSQLQHVAWLNVLDDPFPESFPANTVFLSLVWSGVWLVLARLAFLTKGRP